MKVTREERKDYIILHLEGELNFYNISELKNLFAEIINMKDRYLVIDMKNISYIDSNAIGVIHNARTKLQSLNKELYVNNLSKELREMLNIMGLSFPVIEVE